MDERAGTLPLLQIGICSVPLRDFSRSVAQRTTAKEKPAKFAVEAAESGPPLRTALQNSKLPGMFQEFAAGRLDESQPPIPSPKLALQIDPYSPASAD